MQTNSVKNRPESIFAAGVVVVTLAEEEEEVRREKVRASFDSGSAGWVFRNSSIIAAKKEELRDGV